VIDNEKSKANLKKQFIEDAKAAGVTLLQIFQRLDRARKGYITHKDILSFLDANLETKYSHFNNTTSIKLIFNL